MNPLNLDPNVNYLAQPRAVDIPEWRKGIAAFGDETAALGQGLLALGAQAVGATNTRDQALLDYQRNMDESVSGWKAPEVAQIEDIKLTEQGGAGRLGSYLGYQVPKGLAQLGSMVVSGLGAGAVAKTFASKGIKELAKAEMKNLAADVAKKAVVAPLVEREAGKVAIKQLAERQMLGMQVGATAGIAGMEGGQMYGKLANDPAVGSDAAVLPTLAYTGLATALEYLPLHMAGKAIGLDRFLLRKVIKEDPGLAAKAAELSLKKKALGVVGKVAGGAAAGAATEGITEGLQNLAEQAATKYAQQDPQWASILPTTKEGWSDFWNSAAAGAAVGGVAGAALGPMTGAKRPVTKPVGEVNVPQAETETPAGAGVAQDTQQPQGPTPAEAPPSAPSAAGTEVIPDVVPGTPEAAATAVGEGTAATPVAAPTPTTERPPVQPIGGEVQAVTQPDGGWSVVAADGLIARDKTEAEAVQIRDQEIAKRTQGGQVVKTTTSPQEAPSITPTVEPSNAQQIPSTSPVYENVPRPEQQGGQEVQVPAEEGGQRVLPSGQEQVKEVIRKADGSNFLTPQAASAYMTRLRNQGKLKIKEGPEANKQARARIAKQGDGYVIERLESFAGPRAFTADTNALAQAKQIAATKGAEVARQETGWFQDEDQKWRFELDDSQAKLKPRVFKPTVIADREISVAEGPLGNLLDHKALRAAYPQFVSIPTRIVIDPTKKTVRGYYEHGRGESALVVYAPSERQAVQGLMHEVQHAIQREEGFAPGATPEQFDAVALQKKYKKEYEGLDETLAESRVEADKAYEAGDIETLDLIKELRRGVMAAQKELRELMASPYEMQHKEYMQAPGEREARNVEARLGMTAEERRQTPPRETVPEGWVDRMESRAPSAPTQSTTDFVAQTDFVLGQGWTQRAIDAGILVVNETSPADSASGYFEPRTGKFVVNLDRTPERQSPVDVLLHEGSHASMARMLGSQFTSFHKDLERLAEQGSATAKMAILQATQGAIENINRHRARLGAELFPHRIGDTTLPVPERAAEIQRVRALIEEQNPGLLAEEDLAYYIQLASSAKPAEAGYWRRLLTAIQAWVAQTNFGKVMATLGWRPELSPQLAVELAKQAAQATLRRAELVNTLLGERAKVLRSLPAAAQMGVMESWPESRPPTVSDTWWRSGVATAVASAPQQKAAPQQWVGWLKNQPGVKQEEIDDLGLEDWLKAQEGTVGKGDVENFLRKGGVKVEEVLRGTPADTARKEQIDQQLADIDKEMEALRYEFQASGWLLRDVRTGAVKEADLLPEYAEMARRYGELRKERGDLEVKLQEATELRGAEAKFATYQVPGGENYRELLITVPAQDASMMFDDLRDQIRAAEEAGDNTLARKLNQELDSKERAVPQPYTSSHWSEPNVLVHIRFNERTDVTGKRVLFVEEVQSDLQQEYRKKTKDLQQEIDTNFEGLVARLKAQGDLVVECM